MGQLAHLLDVGRILSCREILIISDDYAISDIVFINLFYGGGLALKKISLIFAAFCALLVASPVLAGNGDALFKQKCGSCHVRGGEAAPVNPGDKAGRVWKKYFLRGRHPVELNVSDAEMDVVLAYLEDHAADSDQPAMAVIPK